jgi:hypothetical protein
LHDDELVCTLSFLSLSDLGQLVRCSHRFNHVVRKERSREEHLECAAAIVPSLLASSLGHHITSLKLVRQSNTEPAATRTTLGQLRSLPQLTALELLLRSNDDVAALLRQLTPENAVAALQAALPTQLRSFEFSIRSGNPELIVQAQLLFKSILAALPFMPQLTTLTLAFHTMSPELRLAVLAQLPQLRKLTLYGIAWTDEQLTEIKQLSQLRELDTRLTLAVLPVHLPQLESLLLTTTSSSEEVIARLAHPTLQQLGVEILGGAALTEEQGQQLLHSSRLPQLTAATACECL